MLENVLHVPKNTRKADASLFELLGSFAVLSNVDFHQLSTKTFRVFTRQFLLCFTLYAVVKEHYFSNRISRLSPSEKNGFKNAIGLG
jgi:hypothetical protein